MLALFLWATVLLAQPTHIPTFTPTPFPASPTPTSTATATRPAPTVTATSTPDSTTEATPTNSPTVTLQTPALITTPGRGVLPNSHTLPTTGAPLLIRTNELWIGLGIFLIVMGIVLWLIGRAASKDNLTW